jgi:ABC-2 type transport system ATP-binding protein
MRPTLSPRGQDHPAPPAPRDVPPIVVARGLRKVYQSYPTPSDEAGGVFLWARQLRRALRATSVPPRTVVALDGIDLEVQRGEILGLMGPNGAGKTTLIKILCGLLTPSAGTACVAGYDVRTQRAAVKRSISYVSTTGWMGLEWALTVEENLRLYARLFGLRGALARARVGDALEAVGLAAHAGQHVYQLSSGMRQRAVLARGLLVRTPLLVLDEPTVGLDPVTARDLRRVVKEDLNGRYGQTVLITSHFAPELERLCDRVGVLVGGKLIALGTVAELCRVVADRTVVDLRVAGLVPETVQTLRAAPGVVQVSSTLHDAGAGTARLRVHLAGDQPLGTVLDLLRAQGTVVRWVGTARAGLEDAFLAYTGDTGDTDGVGDAEVDRP